MSKNPVPTRMCSGCMIRRPKSELIRIVRTEDGKAIIDTKRKMPGRGVYICLNCECIKKAEKRKSFSRGLKGEIDTAIYDVLRNLAQEG